MTQFRLWDLPVNSYCQKVENYGTEAEKLKMDLKQTSGSFFWRFRQMYQNAGLIWIKRQYPASV